MPDTELTTASAFKRCSLCQTEWETKDTFLSDPDIRLNGYQFTGRQRINYSGGGMLIFTHQRTTCGTTLAVYARTLKETGGKMGRREPQCEHREE